MIHRAAVLMFVCALALAAPARAELPIRARAEAAERFDRALRLVNAGDLSGALAEFQRAHALAASPIALYNIGLVFAALHRPVDAARALEQSLAEPIALSPANAERARRSLVEQREIIGLVELSANVKEGVVELDNVQVGRLPLRGPLEVASGPHVLGVIAQGYAPSRREILVAGKVTARVHLELVAIEGLLAQIALACKVPAADVFVDGERIGKTPLEATISVTPGAHRVELRRAGYLPAARTITLQGGSRAEIALTPKVDPTALLVDGGLVAVRASETQAVVSVDGEASGLLTEPLRLPHGPHRLVFERGGFLPAERDLEVQSRSQASISVVFEPTPETRARYVASAEGRRTLSLVTLGAGVVLGAAGAALAVVEHRQLPSAERSLAAARADAEAGSGRACDTMTVALSAQEEARCLSRLRSTADRVNQIRMLQTVGWAGAGVGAAIGLTGLVLWISGDDPHRYDEKPSPRSIAGFAVIPELAPGFALLSASRAF